LISRSFFLPPHPPASAGGGGGIRPEVAQAISANGRVIIGHNAFSNGFIITISPDGDHVGFSDLLVVFSNWD